jgi:arylsulfate sulfotransferase
MKGFPWFFILFFLVFAGCGSSSNDIQDDSDKDYDSDYETTDDDLIFGEITVNPSGNIPLSAEIEVLSDSVAKVEVSVADIIEGRDPFVRVYNVGSENERFISVLGLFPDYENVITFKAYDSQSDILDESDFTVTTDPLPEDFPVVTLTGEIESGWTIVNWLKTPRSRPEMYALAVDELGRTRWFTDFPFAVVFPFKLRGENLYVSDGDEMLYKFDFMGFEKEKWDVSQFGFHEIHHDFVFKDDGNILLAVSKIDDGWSYDRMIEIDPEKNTLRGTWDLKKVFPDVPDLYNDVPMIEEGNPKSGANAPVHHNAIMYDPSDNSMLLSSQRSGIAKITHSGYLKWLLAPQITAYIDDEDGDGISDSYMENYDPDNPAVNIGDFKGENYIHDRMPIAGKPHEVYSNFDFRYQEFLLDPLDKDGNPIDDDEVVMGFANNDDFAWPFRPHSPVILNSGNIMLFDNGLTRNFTFPPFSPNHYSRAVEYEIVPDPTDGYGGTIRQVWDFVIEEDPLWYGFSPVVSNVEELQNGNRLIVSGSLGSGFYPDVLRQMYGDGPVGALIIEVDPSDSSEKNRLLFERIKGEEQIPEFSIYRAYRFELTGVNVSND